MLRVMTLALCLVLAGCISTERDGEPPMVDSGQGLAPFVPWMMSIGARSATDPVFDAQSEEVRFSLRQGQCSSATDLHGAGDCATGAARTVLSSGERWRLGMMHMISFEFLVDPDLSIPAYRDASGALNSRLAIARWQGADVPTELFELQVDATRGVTFMGQTCVPPSGFGSWQRIFLRVHWRDDSTGFLEVRCGNTSVHSGQLIFAAANLPTNRPLRCDASGNCAAVDTAGAHRFNMQLGLMADRAADLPANGLELRMRRIIERRLYVVFGREDTL